MTVDAAHANGIWAGVCGEIAGDPMLAPLLVGLGVDELSAAPAVIDQVKYIIRRIKLDEARQLAEYALASESPTQILARCVAFARQTAPSLFDGKT
jgi:phosphotransferase system enzyme I (PtsI)